MVDLPDSAKRLAFQELFVRGAIFFCENYVFDDSSHRSKLLLVMNPGNDAEECCYYLPTSKVEKIRSSPILSQGAVIVSAGTMECFPVETAINTRSYLTKKRVHFESRYVHPNIYGELSYRCICDEAVMREIDTRIRASIHIPLAMKKRLLMLD
jgi:hypothetical protein